MRVVAASILLACLVVYVTSSGYTNRYDNLNIPEILQNRRLLGRYIECGLDKAPCNKEGAELKSHIKDALENGCAQCSDKQKNIIKKVCKHLRVKEPGWWKELTAKYDPNGEFEKKYADWLKEIDAEPLD